LLSGLRIRDFIANGTIGIEPFSLKQLNPNSYNLRLAPELWTYKAHILDCKINNPVEKIEINDSGFMLHPGKVYLGRTIEYTETKYHIPALEGRSSLGRLGLDVHATAGFGDIGFCGCWTLELSVKQPLVIYAGMEICQICYHTIEGNYDRYEGKYQNSKEIVESRIHNELQRGV
jgi:dCTP deaminase